MAQQSWASAKHAPVYACDASAHAADGECEKNNIHSSTWGAAVPAVRLVRWVRAVSVCGRNDDGSRDAHACFGYVQAPRAAAADAAAVRRPKPDGTSVRQGCRWSELDVGSFRTPSLSRRRVWARPLSQTWPCTKRILLHSASGGFVRSIIQEKFNCITTT